MQIEQLVAEPGFERLKKHLIDLTGLEFYATRDVDLAGRVAHRMTRLAVTTAENYLDILRTQPRELEELIAALTIGETYFFRHREQWDALRDTALPELMQHRQREKTLFAWSAGCANGAEVYSLAILLRRDLDLRGWDVSLLGTDLNANALEAARDGTYGDWSLRGTDPATRVGCFLPRGKQFQIRNEFKQGVTFAQHNLVQDTAPGFFDLILCRNVLMYFDRPRAAEVIERFYQALRPDGWLMVGHSDAESSLFSKFHSVQLDGTVLFRKTFSPPAPAPPPPRPPARPARRGSPLQRIRDLADRGLLEPASSECRIALADGHASPTLYLYQALIQAQLGMPTEKPLEQALALDPGYVPALFYQAMFALDREDRHQARTGFRTLRAHLARLTPTTAFPEMDQITARELSEVAAMHLRTLDA